MPDPEKMIEALGDVDPIAVARLFHRNYERLAPQFGYETRAETRDFDPESQNGRLMVACAGLMRDYFVGVACLAKTL